MPKSALGRGTESKYSSGHVRHYPVNASSNFRNVLTKFEAALQAEGRHFDASSVISGKNNQYITE